MLKDFIPPILFKAKRALFPAGSPDHGWFGDYVSWQDAVAATSGYDQDQILSRILDATRKVESGQAAYERDGVLFDRVQHNWPLLASLMWVAAREAGELRVCDFGGSLGTVYRQSRSFLGHLGHLRWGVVEQPHFVAAGKAEFETQALSFYETLAECRNALAPTTLLLSSVLQYLPEPYAFLDQAVSLGFPYLILDRTALIDAPEDRLTVQIVNPRCYTGSYPCWFLSEKRLTDYLSRHYTLIADFPSFLGETVYIDGKTQAYNRGFLLRNNAADTSNTKQSGEQGPAVGS